MLVLGLTYSVAALAGRLADEHAGYQGQWRLGVRMDRLRGAVPLDTLQDALRKPGSPYTVTMTNRVSSGWKLAARPLLESDSPSALLNR
jgi:hypothetical protein